MTELTGTTIAADKSGSYVVTKHDEDCLVARLHTTDRNRALWAATLDGAEPPTELPDGSFIIENIWFPVPPLADDTMTMEVCREFNLRRMRTMWQLDPGGIGDKNDAVDIAMARYYADSISHELSRACRFALNLPEFSLVVTKNSLFRQSHGLVADIVRVGHKPI